mmetsp:Transcript_6087/g.9894  ORF Transcript_6087/g.9894 Transcript_6087/m.9894 type:complete len:280 (+) Transcript_6087:98-937(+)
MNSLFIFTIALLFVVSAAFKVTPNRISSRATMSMTSSGLHCRRDVLAKSLLAGAALAGGLPGPSHAASLTKVNNELRNQGLPPLVQVPEGLTPLLEVYGKVKTDPSISSVARERYLVQFCHPSLWVVQRPSITINGEDGTVAAGDYQKGDSATLYVGNPLPAGAKLSEQKKDFFEQVVLEGITQKGDNMYQNLKVKKVVPLADGYKGAQYMMVDFKYELVTGAGFTVDRSAVAVVTAVGKNTQALIMATTDKRYKKLETVFRDMAGTFKVYDNILYGDI